MRRFENAQVGDKVVCLLAGEGIIIDIDGDTYPVNVKFGKADYDQFMLDGRMHQYHKNPSLFYLGENGEMLTERPVPKPLTIHPDKVPVDTKVLCSNYTTATCKRYFAKANYTFRNGCTSWSTLDLPTFWNYMQLAEELTVDGTTYPVGTMIKEVRGE